MSDETLYRQYQLWRPGEEGSTIHLVTWLPEKKGGIHIDVGVRLTLDSDPDVWWNVECRTSMTLRKDEVRGRRDNASQLRPLPRRGRSG